MKCKRFSARIRGSGLDFVEAGVCAAVVAVFVCAGAAANFIPAQTASEDDQRRSAGRQPAAHL
jgi:hypothetical protein